MKILQRSLSLLICFVILFEIVCTKAQAGLFSSETTYVKEVITSTADTDAAAKKWLTDNGYTVVPNNLNKGTDEDPVYLGYKTTTDKNEAITDISFMDMNGGYEWMDYETFAAQNQSNIAEMTQNLAGACKEMKQKLKGGSRAAEIALSYLNLFTVPEANQKLGDYLLDEKRTDTEYRRILLVCNSLVTNIIYSELSLGCTDAKEENWITRVSAEGPDTALRGEEHAEYWSNQNDAYYHDAEKLLAVLKTFADEYKSAVERKAENNGEIVFSSVTTEEQADVQVQSFVEDGNLGDEGDTDALTFAVYQYLNRYTYGSNASLEEDDGYRLFPQSSKLGDVLLELAEIDGDNEEQLSLLYPLIRAFTPAQFHLLTVQGLSIFTSFSIAGEEELDTIEQQREEQAAKLYEALGNEVASVWIGTNRDIFENEIGITTKAKREADASSDYDELTRVSNFDARIKNALIWIGGITAGCVGVALVTLGLGAIIFHGVSATLACGMAIITASVSATVSGVAFGCFGVVFLAASAFFAVTLVICAIIFAVDYFTDLYNYYNPDFTEIPKVMVDSRNSYYYTYKAVNGKNGKPADLNVWEGKRWNTLYVSYDPTLGAPLTESSAGKAFSVVYGSTSVPSGSTPVVRFGQTRAVNLNSNTYDDDVNGIYLYFYPETPVEKEIEPTEEIPEEENAVYLESLVLLTNENARAVKNLISLMGYTLIDYNLTSGTDWASYIGYTTTKNPDNAITDIRVSYAGNKEKGYFGTASDTYGMAGTTSETTSNESTDLLASLYYTKSSKRGTPIYADLFISGSRKSIDEGYEPVNLFSGGDAFDFNTRPEEDDDTWKKHSYIYFKPSVVYNSTNSKAYLGGIAFVSGSTDMSEGKLDAYVNELNLTSSKINLASGFYEDEDRNWLCYYTTYNPYRAIYDIGVYTAEYNSEFLPESIILDGIGYMACQIYTQGDLTYYGNTFWGGHYRLIRADHAYISRNETYGGCDEYGDTEVCNRGMYVAGPIAGKEPISMDSFTVSKTATIPEGSVAVHDMTDKFAEKALNLAMSDGDHKNKMYIFYAGTAPVKQKYISKVSVFYSEEEDYSYDTVMYQLMASDGDEIIRVNLAAPSGDSWRYTDGNACFDEDSDRDDYEDAHAFLRVTRTAVKNDAIGTLCMVEGKSGGATTLTLPYNNQGKTAVFKSAGKRITYDENKSYYLYYATVGNKVTDVSIDKVAVQHDWITALNENQKLCTNAGFYFHTYSDTSLPYYSFVRFHRNSSKITAISNLLALGCTDVERININGDPVYIGWARTATLSKAVKNILVTNYNPLPDGYEDYVCGSSAHGVYIYYTTAGDKNKAITHFKVSKTVPTDYGTGLTWEYAQTAAGRTADLNTVVDNTDSKVHYRMFINHKDNQPFSDSSVVASVFDGNGQLLTAVILAFVPLAAVSVVIVVRKKTQKRKEENET